MFHAEDAEQGHGITRRGATQVEARDGSSLVPSFTTTDDATYRGHEMCERCTQLPPAEAGGFGNFV